jgi:hypothetical protein
MDGKIVFTVCVDCGKALPKESANGRCRACDYLAHKRSKNLEWKRLQKGNTLPTCAANTSENMAAWSGK